MSAARSKQKITPFLWFDDQAESAVKFYRSVFRKSRVIKTVRYGAAGERATGRPKESVMTIEFELEGQRFVALNGGPHFKFNEAISFVVDCRTQAEIDRLCQKLCARGQKMQCGWLKDQFGVSWQIVPSGLSKLLGDRDSEKAQRVMQALLRMQKLDIKKLKQAYRSQT